MTFCGRYHNIDTVLKGFVVPASPSAVISYFLELTLLEKVLFKFFKVFFEHCVSVQTQSTVKLNKGSENL